MSKVKVANRFTENYQFWLLIAYLAVVFVAGGSSRADSISLVLIRPLSFIVLCIGLLGLKREQVRRYRFLFMMAILLVAVPLLQLIPLPPALWTALPGRAILADLDKLSGAGEVWRPISMVPAATWNALYSLAVPIAVLVLGVQMATVQHSKLLLFLIIFVFSSGALGVLQLFVADGSLLYFHDVMSFGSMPGLLANRNHQALLLACAFPMLAVYAMCDVQSIEQRKIKELVWLLALIVLVPLILVTGSRAGALLALLAGLSILWIYRRPHHGGKARRTLKTFDPRIAIAIIGITGMAFLTFIMSRAISFDRFSDNASGEDRRLVVFQPIVEMASKYFPFGSGVGSFVEVYQIDEPINALDVTYLNHAHNDWLEVFMTAGFMGLALLLVALVAFLITLVRVARSQNLSGASFAFRKLGIVLIGLMGLASIPDYPLRAPSMMCVFVIACIWAAGGASKRTDNLSSK